MRPGQAPGAARFLIPADGMIRFLRRLSFALAALLILTVGVVSLVGPAHFPRLMGLLRQGAGTGLTVGGPFALLDAASGKPFTQDNLRGHWTLLYFGYTFCPDICPTDLAKAVQVLTSLGPDGAAITPVFITVDPARDTPSVMDRYVALFSPRLVGLTGSQTAIDQAESDFRVFAEKQPVPNGGSGAYLMNHSAFFYLMNPQGEAAAILPPQLDATGMVAAIRRAIGKAATS
ncbi:SCO family protein [Acidisoma cellulosilytica]|uniref:SCO family protein n=1 Tax=Acidisoma cellulosilyticum TaxID=2802395 RepID=A0A963YZV0_9PROT|nr:SCO family protein [Acidisoma cellulosilyticum]MCB8879971.1 SCO family protein [Acidisoma cellulosilyticum]